VFLLAPGDLQIGELIGKANGGEEHARERERERERERKRMGEFYDTR
jgi:hypothetical protein